MKKKKENKEKTITNSIDYSGSVMIEKVKYGKVIDKKIIKNTGCFDLFRFFADCLSAYSSDDLTVKGLFNAKPQYLNGFTLVNPVTDLDVDHCAFKSYLKQRSVDIKAVNPTGGIGQQQDAECTVEMKFLLQASNLYANKPVHVLALYNANNVTASMSGGRTPSAYIYLGEENKIEYETGTNIIITWKLTLANKVKTE